MVYKRLCIKVIKCAFAFGIVAGRKELYLEMKNRTFCGGLVIGALVGIVLGLVIMLRKPLTPMEEAKIAIGRVANEAMKKVHSGIGHMAGRFSG